MFDARSLLESILRGPARQPAPSAPSGDPVGELSDLLRQFTQGGPQRDTAPAPRADPVPRQTPPGGTGRDVPYADRPYRDEPDYYDDAPSQRDGPSADSLNDLWGELFPNAQPPQTYQAAVGGSSASQSPLDVLGQIFGQATQGVQEGAGEVGKASGLNEIIEQMSGGRSAEELLEQAKKYMAENQLGTGAALGGLGALVLGTGTGRSIAMSAAKIGALALIGGLAYKAYQNYQQGRPLISGPDAPEPPPTGSGFEPTEVSNDDALRMIRCMIAAAAADGRLDSTEQQKIIGNMQGTGLDGGAEEFLAREMNAPAGINELAQGVTSEQQAVKLYTAARIAIDPDTTAEQSFLYQLGMRLGIEEELMAHIDAQARAAA
jgi:uncharacterized membrane protein YebE (DUF533 family)